jgi:hypothetical protein
MTKNWRKFTCRKKKISKIAIYISLGLHKGGPSYTKEAFSPQKRISSTS